MHRHTISSGSFLAKSARALRFLILWCFFVMCLFTLSSLSNMNGLTNPRYHIWTSVSWQQL